MSKQPRKSGLNVVSMLAKGAQSSLLAEGTTATRPAANVAPGGLTMPGSPGDPRMKEAMRLMQAFLAIEDAAGRAALITLAERLVNHDWARKAQQG